MDTIKYFEEKKRMLNSLGRTGGRCYSVRCLDCPLYSRNNGIDAACEELELLYPERAIEIIEKWSQEHPRKTMLQDFLEKHPKAPLDNDELPDICAYLVGYGRYKECDGETACFKCWNRPLED